MCFSRLIKALGNKPETEKYPKDDINLADQFANFFYSKIEINQTFAVSEEE